jgi:alkanesulfonate monooxygenase SsuD/methylene tetrahydromethanopterin reductase-like flavin-dependent oxidoreductase (luciferase family)
VVDGAILPVVFGAPTEESARAKAQQRWNEAIEKETARRIGKPKSPRESIEAQFGLGQPVNENGSQRLTPTSESVVDDLQDLLG